MPRPLDLGRDEVLRPAIRADRLGGVVEAAAVAAAVDQELLVEPATEVVLRIVGDLDPREALDQLGIGRGFAHCASGMEGCPTRPTCGRDRGEGWSRDSLRDSHRDSATLEGIATRVARRVGRRPTGAGRDEGPTRRRVSFQGVTQLGVRPRDGRSGVCSRGRPRPRGACRPGTGAPPASGGAKRGVERSPKVARQGSSTAPSAWSWPAGARIAWASCVARASIGGHAGGRS